MKTRKATLKDLKEILILSKKWVKEGISLGVGKEKPKELKKILKEGLSFVAINNKKIVGYLLAEFKKAKENLKPVGIKKGQKYLCLDSLYVSKNYRKRGMGTILMKHFLREVKNKRITLTAESVYLDKLTQFYKKFGFKSCYTIMKKC
jgi:predicted N-acetyltransferase YhbS